jgi:hypothetical protein
MLEAMKLRRIDCVFILCVLIGGILYRTDPDNFGKIYSSMLFWGWFIVYLVPFLFVRFKAFLFRK